MRACERRRKVCRYKIYVVFGMCVFSLPWKCIPFVDFGIEKPSKSLHMKLELKGYMK